MSAERTILIVGASGRAAAESAIRAGLSPFVIDLFADADTMRMCPVLKCPLDEYPHGFIAIATRAPSGPWIYTGGLENHPGVIAAISESRALFGNGPEAVAKVRDPFALAKLVPMPAMRREDEVLDPAKRWLRKPYRSSGGFGIEECLIANPEGTTSHRACPGGALTGTSPPGQARWLVGAMDSSTVGNRCDEAYGQERVAGSPHSALFLLRDTGLPELVGICTQLIGEPWLNAPPFRYCGNIGPLPSDNALTAELRALGNALESLGLRGLIGIDFMLSAEGIVVLEVNPRYTASVELYERASSRALLAEHIRCFETSPPSPFSEAERGDRRFHGKAVLYAGRTFEVPADHPWRGPDFADIPAIGSIISEGQPVVTFFASGDTESECRRKLRELAVRSGVPR